MVFERFKTFVSYWYLHYILNTAMWMLEPTERKCCNTVLLLLLAVVLYSSYLFLPGHALMLIHFFRWLLGVEPAPPMPDMSGQAPVSVEL